MGYTAWINLSNGKIKKEKTPVKIFKEYLGSRGYAAKILYDNVGPEVEPFSSENLLIYSPGPLTGTPWPTGARYNVTAKSPLTGSYGYANASGFFGPELRQAGFDALVIKGKSQRPVYLLIEDDKISIQPADDYWGKSTSEVEKEFKDKYKGSKVSCIGQAGENLVRVAAIVNDKGRTAARAGMGAVMGSKKLKAVVCKANQDVDYSDNFKKVAIEKVKKAGTNAGSIGLRKWGTAILIDPKNQSGDLPAKNHQEVQFPEAVKVNAEAVDEHVYKNTGCYSCPIRCSRHSRIDKGQYKCDIEGPEYETLNSLGPLVWNDDLELLLYANHLCNDLGVDTISIGVIISFVMECQQNGLLSDRDDLADLNLEWGDGQSIIRLIEMISEREEIGDILAEGVARASKVLGPETEKYAMHVKGMELPRQEPRICKAMGLGHATSNRGADHLYGLPTIDLTGNVEIAEKYFPECMPEILETTSQKYKPEMLVFTQEYNAISDALGICKFSTTENFALIPEDIAEGISALIPEIEMDHNELLKAGERIINLERMYNIREGPDRKDDNLPDRFLKEPATVYKLKDKRLTDEPLQENLLVDLDPMLDRYYELRGWDNNGIPTEEKLKELGLNNI